MMLARMSNGDFVFGLDEENVRRLMLGQPCRVDLFPLGGHGRVMLVYGPTLADIMRDLERATGRPMPPAMPLVEPGEKQ